MDTKNVREVINKLFGEDNDFKITVKVTSNGVGLELGENVLDGEILTYLVPLSDAIRKRNKEQ